MSADVGLYLRKEGRTYKVGTVNLSGGSEKPLETFTSLAKALSFVEKERRCGHGIEDILISGFAAPEEPSEMDESYSAAWDE